MRTSTVLVLGGVGLVGYLIYRSLKSTVQSTAARLASPVASNMGIPAGLQAQIDAGTYDANALRMTAQPINFGSPNQNLPPGFFSGYRGE